MGFEPMASSLPRTCSTTELQQQKISRNTIVNHKNNNISIQLVDIIHERRIY